MGTDPAGGSLVVALLGPVEIGSAGGVMTPLAQPRLRVLLGLLGVVGGRVVTAEALVDGLWREEWSPGREKNLHALVYQLRRRLAVLEPGKGGARLVRAGGGYRLVLGPGELDVEVFWDLAGRGRQAARAGDIARARELFGRALGVWRGAALADAAPVCPRLAGEAARLEEARLSVTEERIGADLALGRHGEVAGELAELVAEFPLRERLAGLLMTALYRSGRRGEALAAYDTARRILSEQLGLDPGPELAGLQARVLADDPALAAPAPAAAPSSVTPAAAEGAARGLVPRQLPAGAAFFAGRETELKELDELLAQAVGEDTPDGPGGPVVISAVAGMAGVGKTALAVHWARKVAHRFADGQLYVNLRGYDTEGAAVTADEVTGWFLAALGVPPFQIPADAQARSGLYRSVLAGRRVLIVLDNARDAAQVRPLLPGSPRCLVVVTSRAALVGLAAAEGARPLRLGPLTAEESVRLLAARLGPERVAAEPEAAAELVGRCGHLPLALAVMAARAAANPGLLLGVLAEQLASAADAEAGAAGGGAVAADPGPLEVLETGDPATSLRELLSWSYRQLSRPTAQMFVLLGVHCGPDITVPAAASLAGVSRAEAGQALAELAEASLAAEHRPGRYVLHDLVRVYAARLARADLGESGIRAAVERSLDHCLHTELVSTGIVLPATVTVAPPAPGVQPERLADEAALQDWARAEHQVVLQAIAQAAAAGLITRAWQLFQGQAWLVGGEGYWADFRAVAEAVLAAAEAAGDQVALGWTHLVIGRHLMFIGAGNEDLARALDYFRRAGDLSGQAWSHLAASLAYSVMGDWAEGVTQSGQALALFRQTGDQAGQGWALAGLGEGHARLGNYDLARGYARQALEAGPATGDPTASAMAWDALGVAHSRLDEPGQALTCYRQALALVRDLKNPLARSMLASMLAEFGDACQATGDRPAAVEAWQQAQQVLDDLGWPDLLGVHARLEQAGPRTPPG